jgi:predicted dehydrogenase
LSQKPTSAADRAARRAFLTGSAATLAGAAFAGLHAPAVHAAGSETLRIGLVGCGGRGTGAARQALLADPHVKLVALGDAFRDRLETSLAGLKRDEELAKKVEVKPDHCFVGFDAYKQVIDLCDVVLLCTPPHFRPLHIESAVKASKHVFAEKPVAVDTPGALRVLAACREAKAKNLAVVSGLCYRYEKAKIETMKRVHDGQIGNIVALHTNYLGGPIRPTARTTAMTDMEWQMRDWYYFTWLSGDHIVEQHVHSLDKMVWAMQDNPPRKAFGLGGRQARVEPIYGHIFDHHAVCYEWSNGVKMFAYTRQQDRIYKDVNDYVMGTEGTCDVMRHSITGKNPWQLGRSRGRGGDDMYQNEHNALFASIRAGKPLNNGDYMTQSTLVGIMGRMATYTGGLITWDMVLKSKEDLSPPKYDWDVSLAVPPVAVPGKTKFV